MWVPLTHPLLGTWPATQACALTGNRTGNPLVHRPALNPLSYTSQGTFFKNCILLMMLIQLSQFSPFPPLHLAHPLLPQAVPISCLCPWVMHARSLATLFPMLYFTCPWLFCNYQLVLLNPFTFFAYPPDPSPLWQPSKPCLYLRFCFCSAWLFFNFRFNCW